MKKVLERSKRLTSRLEMLASRLELETKVHTKIHNHGESPYYWLKAPTSAFTFGTLLRHNAKQMLTHGKLGR